MHFCRPGAFGQHQAGKNAFVFTINIAGLVLAEGTDTATLWAQHHELALAIADEVIDVQQWLTGATFDRKRLIDCLIEGINGDLQHKCKGRSARGRLERLSAVADEAGLKIPRITKVEDTKG